VDHEFAGFSEEVHRAPEYPEAFRVQVSHEVLTGIPFREKKEARVILHTLANVTTPASLLRAYGGGQENQRLRQLHALLRKDIHAYDDQDHTNFMCKGLAKKG
jgi:hypothetical protein